MSYSQTLTASSTFTIIHARELASRVIADLHLCSRYYGQPNESWINSYRDEFVLLLSKRYVDRYEFGFKKDGRRVVCWSYSVNPNGSLSTTDRPGGVVSDADISGATFYNYLWYSNQWSLLSNDDREEFIQKLPFRRGEGAAPTDGNGYWVQDRTYCAGGTDIPRRTFRPL